MSYIESLKLGWIAKKQAKAAKAKAAKPPVAMLSASVNKKGSLVIRCRRDPKACTVDEYKEAAKGAGISQSQMWAELKKRKIEVKEKI